MRRRIICSGAALGLALALCGGADAASAEESISSAFNVWVAGFMNDLFELVDSLMVDLLDSVFFAENLVSSARCAAWKAGERQFYLIEFHVETRAII